MKKLIKRWQNKNLKNAIKKRRVVTLAGARQSGKTTLTTELKALNPIYRNLDVIAQRKSAQDDPEGFVSHGNELMIIDEIQKVPELLHAIKYNVDENNNYGRFLITGSAHIGSIPGASESLAGRVKTLRLRSLSQGEIYNKEACFIENAFKENFINSKDQMVKDDYIRAAIMGGFPEAIRLGSIKEAQDWYKDYIFTLLERDLKDVANIKRVDSLKNLLECLAAWSSKYMDLSKLCAGLSLQRSTANSFINALEAMFIVERMGAWISTDYERIKRKDKLFMADTGLMSSILNWNFEKVQLDGELNGKLIETLVFTELSAICEASESDYSMYHYRDRLKREIDFIIQNENGEFLGIEVKAGSSIKSSSFNHMKWFKENIIKEEKFIGIILYTGFDILPFGKNMWAVPINCLWS